MSEKLDVLAFGAHPDDVELAVAASMLKMKKLGYRTGVVDFTRGERSSRGNVELRARETARATEMLGLDARQCLDIPDTGIFVTDDARRRVAEVVRKHRPTVVLAPYYEDLHPDHRNAGRIVADSCYLTGVARYARGSPWRPAEVLFYFAHLIFEPGLVVDVTGEFEEKMEVIRAYASQLHTPDDGEPATKISRKDFPELLRSRARYFGSLIGVEYGEAFRTRRPLPVSDPVALWSGR